MNAIRNKLFGTPRPLLTVCFLRHVTISRAFLGIEKGVNMIFATLKIINRKNTTEKNKRTEMNIYSKGSNKN